MPFRAEEEEEEEEEKAGANNINNNNKKDARKKQWQKIIPGLSWDIHSKTSFFKKKVNNN